MQQPAGEFVNDTARLKQGAIIAARSGRDDPVVVHLWEYQRHCDAAQGGGAQRLQYRGVRHKIGCRQGDCGACAPDGRGKEMRCGPFPLGRAKAQGLCRKAVFCWLGSYRAPRKPFAGCIHPVGCEKQLILRNDGPAEPQHDVDPRRVIRLDLKFGIRRIATATIGDLPVDHRDFAVIAQINAAVQ